MELEKGIYPVEDGSHYGEILYRYTDLEEAKRDYKNQTGEELDVENLQTTRVEAVDNGDGFTFSWEKEGVGELSMMCIY